MSASKRVLKPYPVFDNVTIDSNKTSSETDISGIDSVFFEVDWNTSTAVGAITVQVLYTNSDDWLTLDFVSAIAISGSSGSHQIKIKENPFWKVRLVYTSTSGSGNLNAWIQGKGV